MTTETGAPDNGTATAEGSRLERAIGEAQQQGRGVFMPFLVIGDPDLETSHLLTDALVAAGSDILEFGFAFSDPPADGPTIQAADDRALATGMTPSMAFEYLREVRSRHRQPIVLLMYYNLILQYPGGVKGFYQRAAEVGVDAVLVADLPIEMAQDALAAAAGSGIHPVFIVTATTEPDRLKALGQASSGFTYVAARAGVTGEQQDIAVGMADTLALIKLQIDLPLLCGFGISTPGHVASVLAAGADGAIVGSAVVKRIESNLGDPQAMVSAVAELAGAMKAATVTN